MGPGMRFQALRGFRDYLPPDAQIRADMFWTVRQVARRAGFSEVEPPSLESLDLFRAKSGEGIVGETFSFVDKGGREVTLTPENTPSLARLYVERAKVEPLPVKWFTLPKLWRYEEPQSGRTREFSQCVLDIFGVPGVEAEIDLLLTTRQILEALGLAGRFMFRVNDRRVADGMGRSLGASETGAFFRALDRRPKLDPSAFREELRRAGLDEAAQERLAGFLRGTDGGVPPGRTEAALTELSQWPGFPAPAAEGVRNLRELFAQGSAAGLDDVLVYDPTIVRGLAYYTSTVFEAYDRGGKIRALFGGGRYDQLVELFGGAKVPACGLAMGDQTLEILLREAGRWSAPSRGLDVYVAVVDPQQGALALPWVRDLRSDGFVVDHDLLGRPLSRQMKDAARRNASFLLLLGPEEVARGTVTLRNMQTGRQEAVAAGDVRAALRKLLRPSSAGETPGPPG